MDDLNLKSRLDDALERQLEPLRPEVTEILATGRRARRRRTAALSGLTVAVLTAVVCGTGWLATSGLNRLDGDTAEMASDPSGRPATEPTVAVEKGLGETTLPRTDDETTTACRRVMDSSTGANALALDTRQTELVAVTSNPLQAWALFESRDGQVWGRCELREDRTEMAVFRTTIDAARPDHYVQTGQVCGEGECRTEARMLAKLPSEVQQVQIIFADHRQLLRQTPGGWVAITHLLNIKPGQPAVRRVTYYGRDGVVLAEYANTTLAGVKDRGLPPLTAYPALSDEEPLNYEGGAYID